MVWKTSKEAKETKRKNGLLTGAAIFAAAAALSATPALAQDDDDDDDDETIVVTGTLIRGNTNTVSPITVVSEEALEARGVNTIQDAIQQLTANNGPSLPNSFSANGAFAGGASAASLRGLTTSSSLVLFDGLRAAYYPLADDGTRNFVDLNTIPDAIVERVEVLRDGASSLYGADAIAGVINIITRREFEGIGARIEAGQSERGDAEQSRFSVTAGWGNLREDGVNAYVSLSHYESTALRASDRPYPYNSLDSSNICSPDGLTCGGNSIRNANGALSTVGDFLIRPYTENPDGTITAVPGGRWERIQGACGIGGELYDLTLAQQGATGPAQLCLYDDQEIWGFITPDIERWGLSTRASFELPGNASAFVAANFHQSTVSYLDFIPAQFYANAPTGIDYPRFSSSQQAGTPGFDPSTFLLNLPVWVCQDRVDCDTDPGRVLNPNNPYAALDQVARIIGVDRFSIPPYNETRNRIYRFSTGASGTFENGWDWDISGTAMHTDLQRFKDGYVYIQRMLDVIADGTYNFADPSSPTSVPWAQPAADVEDYLTPPRTGDASSDLMQLQGSLTMPLFEMPGGTAQLAVGASWIYEAVDAPSLNDDYNGATQRYFRFNAFGTVGSRTAQAAFFELNAPVIENVEVNLSGRYDDYSSGQSAFSPKIGIRWDPLDMLALRATYSEGFRIPSFGEANALPTTGYVTNNVGLFNDTYLAQYGCSTATYNTCPTYITNGSYGQTTLASPNLEPEESTSLSLGFVLRPIEGLSIAVDYYEIEKTGGIATAQNSLAILAYYNGDPIPAGFNVVPDAPDAAFPLAQPRLAFVESNLINTDTIRVEGWDFAINYQTDLTENLSWRSSLDMSHIQLLETEFANGTVERYDGTLGNFNLTAGSGTPSWRGQWVNTFSFGMFDVTGTVNYFQGYDLSAMDQGSGYNDCSLDPGYSPTGCTVDDAISYDLNIQAHLNDNVTIYGTVLNVTDELPPVDVVTYGAWHYNPVQSGDMIYGRYFRLGARVRY